MRAGETRVQRRKKKKKCDESEFQTCFRTFPSRASTHMRARATLSRTQYRQGCEYVAILLSRLVILK